jgi:hypothetical protein
MNGSFREAKLHWPLSGDELDERSVASRTSSDGRTFGAYARFAAIAVSSQIIANVMPWLFCIYSFGIRVRSFALAYFSSPFVATRPTSEVGSYY